MEERVGQKSHLVGVGEEPVVGMGEGDIGQDEETAKQRHAKDDGEGTEARARVWSGRWCEEIRRRVICHGMDGRWGDRAMVSDRKSPRTGDSGLGEWVESMRRIGCRVSGDLACQVVLLGMRWATARSPAITVKISGMPVVGREAEMHEFLFWDAV